MTDATFHEINQMISKYLRERDWDSNTPRSIAISISLEASELLEHYQWHEDPVGNQEELANELADVLIYAFQFAEATGIDIPLAIRNKLKHNSKKYPAESFKGKNSAEQQKVWIDKKLSYKKDYI